MCENPIQVPVETPINAQPSDPLAGEDSSEFALTANSALMGNAMTVLGLVTTVVGPVITALSANPIIQGNTTLAGILSAAGVLVMACGVALKALTGNAYVAARTQLKIAHLNSGK